ncbi:MAG: hypothetical protein LBV69_11030 [Bacteroidales bacterium]|nr:hypothetical protein [Bacteroidales bacterium]
MNVFRPRVSKTQIILLLFLCFTICFICCEKPEPEDNNNNNTNSENEYMASENIIGTWKLMEIRNVYTKPSTNEHTEIIEDYSSENIIYNFTNDSVLIIIGNIPDDDFIEGEHLYACQQVYISYNSTLTYNLTIDNNTDLFCVTSFPNLQNISMTITQTKFTDGQVLAYNKIFRKNNKK